MTVFGDGRALAIVNPIAGGWGAQARLDELVRIFHDAGAHVDIVRTPGPSEATRLAHDAVEEGYGRVLAIGGDGTVNEVVNGVAGAGAEIAVLPCGTGQDFGRTHGIPTKFDEAVRIAISGTARAADVGRASFDDGKISSRVSVDHSTPTTGCGRARQSARS